MFAASTKGDYTGSGSGKVTDNIGEKGTLKSTMKDTLKGHSPYGSRQGWPLGGNQVSFGPHNLRDTNKPLGVSSYQLEEVVERTVKELEHRMKICAKKSDSGLTKHLHFFSFFVFISYYMCSFEDQMTK